MLKCGTGPGGRVTDHCFCNSHIQDLGGAKSYCLITGWFHWTGLHWVHRAQEDTVGTWGTGRQGTFTTVSFEIPRHYLGKVLYKVIYIQA